MYLFVCVHGHARSTCTCTATHARAMQCARVPFPGNVEAAVQATFRMFRRRVQQRLIKSCKSPPKSPAQLSEEELTDFLTPALGTVCFGLQAAPTDTSAKHCFTADCCGHDRTRSSFVG